MKDPYLQIPPQLAQWAIQALTRLGGTACFVQGFLIIEGGRDRWSGEAYVTALTVPGAPASWGWVLLLAGVTSVAATFTRLVRLVASSLVLMGLWCWFFSGSFALTVARGPRTVSTTGVTTYGWLGATAFVLAVVYYKAGALHAKRRSKS